MMLSLLYICVLTTLTQANPPPSASLRSNLPEGCEDFTLGSCNTEQDELIEKYDKIPDAKGCQSLCGIIERCKHFRYSKSTQECELFHFRFISTCNKIGGPKDPLVKACSNEDSEGSCHSFINEDCTYNGEIMMVTKGVTGSAACQDILIQFGTAIMLNTSFLTRVVRIVSYMILIRWSVPSTVDLTYLPWSPAIWSNSYLSET